MNKPTLIHIVTVPIALATFFKGQVRFMNRRGFDVQAISSPGKLLGQFANEEHLTCYPVTMPRKITPLRDLFAIFSLCQIIRKVKPQIVHAHTPKGGLLGMIAAWVTGVPIRVYHIRGLPLMTAGGFHRWLLRLTEKIACRLAHRVLCVSHSLRAVAIGEDLCNPKKLAVLGAGSGNGVDTINRFNPRGIGLTVRNRIRHDLGIAQDDLTMGFVGRIVRDKGIVELIEAWETLRKEFSNLHLLMIGTFDSRDSVSAEVKRFLQNDPRIHLVGQIQEMPEFYNALDVCVLPTYREGLPNVLLEAAAMERPVVATDITGCVDAVIDGQTGFLVPVRDSKWLARALSTYLNDPSLRLRHGKAARRWVQENFSQEEVWSALHLEYLRLADQLGVGLAEVQQEPLERRTAA